MSQVRELHKDAKSFAIGVGRTRFDGWVGTNGRWYIRRVAGGKTTDSASYASRRACRRAILTRIAQGDA